MNHTHKTSSEPAHGQGRLKTILAATHAILRAEPPARLEAGNIHTIDRHKQQYTKLRSPRCSFGLFNFDSYESFRASGVIWGIREFVGELVNLLISSLFLVPTLWETDN